MNMRASPARRRLSRPLLLLVAVLLAMPFVSGCYLSQVALGQIKLSCDSVPIEQALQMNCLNEHEKARLRDVLDIRLFAEQALHLKRSRNFSTYYPGPHEPLNWVVTAAPEDQLTPVTWWFPVVGRISYKGFFDEEAAQAEARDLSKQGYDVSVQPVLAYSTMGWFTDPVMPLMLDMDNGSLARLLIHELTHGTVYAPGHTTFNESLAEFVGREGGRQFLVWEYGAGSEKVKEYDAQLADEAVIDVFMHDAARRLAALYATHPADLGSARINFFAQMYCDFRKLRPQLKTARYRKTRELGNVNNAVMVAYLTYDTMQPFEEAFASVGGDWAKFIALAGAAARCDDPVKCLREKRP